MQVLRGTNTGASQTWRLPVATLLPNIGSKYVGRNQAHPCSATRLLDVGAQRGIDDAAPPLGLRPNVSKALTITKYVIL